MRPKPTMRENSTHWSRFMWRATTIASQLYHGEMTREEFDKAYKRLGDQIENELKKQVKNSVQ